MADRLESLPFYLTMENLGLWARIFYYRPDGMKREGEWKKNC